MLALWWTYVRSLSAMWVSSSPLAVCSWRFKLKTTLCCWKARNSKKWNCAKILCLGFHFMEKGKAKVYLRSMVTSDQFVSNLNNMKSTLNNVMENTTITPLLPNLKPLSSSLQRVIC